MARFEVPISTPLRFRRDWRAPAATSLADPPETVAIEFEARTFVWHALLPVDEDDYDPGPTVTVVVEEGRQPAAAEALQRFLSALAFHFHIRIEATGYGGSGEIDPMHPAVVRSPSREGWQIIMPAPAKIEVTDDQTLRLALALYREGLNSGSPFYRFLAFWNVLDAVFRGAEARRDAFLDARGPDLFGRWLSRGLPPTRPAKHLRQESRNAIAHVVRQVPTDTSIDPDLPDDRERLDLEARWLQDLAEAAITEQWPQPVTIAHEHEWQP